MSYTGSISGSAGNSVSCHDSRTRVGTVVLRIGQWLKYRRDRQHVLELPDYLISDIGLRRSEVCNALRRNGVVNADR